jgi:hypothetical protein
VYQYRIEKDRLAVTIRLHGGERVNGYIFVQPSIYRHLGREEPVDVFNAPEPFFPLQSELGTLLLAKDRVIEAWPAETEPEEEEDEMRHASARAVGVQLTLTDGSERCGTILLELPSDRPRVLDFLNTMTDRFISMYDEDGALHLVNTRAIERVRPLD